MVKKVGIGLAAVLCAVLCLVGYARFVEPNMLTVKSFSVDTRLPIRDCRVVYFSDTHFGRFYDVAHAAAIVDGINALDADVVVFGGDLIDNYARDVGDLDLDALRAELGRIQAKAGKFAVWGNHDYGGGAVRIYQDLMASCGFEVLDDESRTLDDYGIELVGFDDYLMGQTDPSAYAVQGDAYALMVSHEPLLAQLVTTASEGYLLSGHTHGGQIGVPGLTSLILPDGSGPFVKGAYTAQDIGTESPVDMFVSSGVGMTKYPLRLFNVPEVIAIDFRARA